MAEYKYPIIRPTIPEVDQLGAEIREILASGIVTCGPHVARLEKLAAERLGVADCVAVSCCTSGLMLAAKALDLSGEVILPSFTFAATAHALVWNGLVPVFCDSLPGTYNIDPDRIESLITERTSAIMPVHIFGLPAEMDRITELARKHGLKVLCDSAQALGATYKGRPAGGLGDVEVFSLSPTKVVTAVEGGLVAVREPELARRLRSMRDYGKGPDGSDMEFVGLSARMSELHAAVGCRCLAQCDDLVTRRGKLVALYRQFLADLPEVSFQDIPADRTSSHNYMVIFVGESSPLSRDDLHAALGKRSIQTKKYFHPAVHEMTAYRKIGVSPRAELLIAERASREGLALPLYSHMAEADVTKIAGDVRELLK